MPDKNTQSVLFECNIIDADYTGEDILSGGDDGINNKLILLLQEVKTKRVYRLGLRDEDIAEIRQETVAPSVREMHDLANKLRLWKKTVYVYGHPDRQDIPVRMAIMDDDTDDVQEAPKEGLGKFNYKKRK
jgi:hypothetical protein